MISNGQLANASNYNAAFLSKTQDTAAAGRIATAKYFMDGVADAAAAYAGGGQANATLISKGITRFTTVTTAGDSCKLPAAEAGMILRIFNATSNALAIFPNTGAQIDGGAANSAIPLPANSDITLVCRAPLQWVSLAGQEASATVRGVVGTGAQSFAGIKTFVNGLVSSAKATFARYIAIASQAIATSGTFAQLDSSYGYARMTSASAKAVTGILAGEDGQRLVISNTGAGVLSIYHQNSGALAADRIITPTGATVTLQPNYSAALVYDATQQRWVFESSAGASGGGGGGSLTWIEPNDGTSPMPVVEDGALKYSFEQNQKLYCAIRVPQSYIAGTQLFMYLAWQTSASSGTLQMNTIATLVRMGTTSGPGTDNFSSTTNQYTDTGTGFALDGTYPSKVCGQVCDLTNSSGQINGVSVAPGDLILVQLKRKSTDTAANDIKVAVHATEVKFSA